MTQDLDVFRQIADHLSDVAWMADADLSEAVYVNPAYEAATGRPSERATEDHQALALVHPNDRVRVAEWFDAVASTVEAGAPTGEHALDLRVRDPASETRWMEAVAVPVRDDDGTLLGLAAVDGDVTDRVEHEAELREQVERLDQFASVVAHDLRNPLNVALGRLALYRETGEEANLDVVADALETIDELTTELLTLARRGGGPAECSEVSLAAASRAAWDEVDTREATLAVAADRTLEASGRHLELLLANLFRNSVGHGGFDVTVRVGALPDGFYVEDTGQGIPESERAHVFDHGFSTGYSGSGVGLTIVEQVADAHDWTVALAESDAGGARFEFRGAADA